MGYDNEANRKVSWAQLFPSGVAESARVTQGQTELIFPVSADPMGFSRRLQYEVM